MEMNTEMKFNDETVTLIEQVGEILKSRTQSIKVLLIEKDGEKLVSFQKWWRKSADEPWMEGKGFHLKLDESTDVANYLTTALKLVEN